MAVLGTPEDLVVVLVVDQPAPFRAAATILRPAAAPPAGVEPRSRATRRYTRARWSFAARPPWSPERDAASVARWPWLSAVKGRRVAARVPHRVRARLAVAAEIRAAGGQARWPSRRPLRARPSPPWRCEPRSRPTDGLQVLVNNAGVGGHANLRRDHRRGVGPHPRHEPDRRLPPHPGRAAPPRRRAAATSS